MIWQCFCLSFKKTIIKTLTHEAAESSRRRPHSQEDAGEVLLYSVVKSKVQTTVCKMGTLISGQFNGRIELIGGQFNGRIELQIFIHCSVEFFEPHLLYI